MSTPTDPFPFEQKIDRLSEGIPYIANNPLKKVPSQKLYFLSEQEQDKTRK